MILRYNRHPDAGIKVRWMTEITHVEPLKYFVDEQRFGPYMLWHHQHHFEQRGDKTFMVDEVNYVMPMYFIGTIMHAVMVRRQLNEIFDYRKKMIDQIFPPTAALPHQSDPGNSTHLATTWNPVTFAWFGLREIASLLSQHHQHQV